MNEQIRILKMLEDGKINADEAARLLEAVRSSTPHGAKRRHRIIDSFEHIPEIIAAKINGSFKHACAKANQTFASKAKIVFKGISGDLKVRGRSGDTIDVQQDGFVKTLEEEDALILKGLGGDIQIDTPPQTDLTIKGASGNIMVENIDGCVKVKTVSGDIKASNMRGDFHGAFVSGDVGLDYEQLKSIDISAKAANIVLAMGKKTEAAIEVETLDGEITCDFSLENEERTEHTLKGILNKKTGKISIKNEHGDVHIRQRAE